jgi:hypothetical protein
MNQLLSDGGERKTFDTGAVREPPYGKGRFDLLSPIVIELWAKHCESGAVKYPEADGRNWEKGMPVSRFIDAAMRHLNQFREGLTDEPHRIAALWNLACAIHTQEMVKRGLLPPELDDMPTYVSKGGDV